MKRIFPLIALVLLSLMSRAQILHPVKWSYGAKRINSHEAVVFMKATIEDGWHIYSQTVADGGPVKTNFNFKTATEYSLNGGTSEPKPITRYEKVFSMNVSYFEHEVIFQQRVKLKGKGPVEVKGTLEYMTCNDNQCLPPDNIDFSIPVK